METVRQVEGSECLEDNLYPHLVGIPSEASAQLSTCPVAPLCLVFGRFPCPRPGTPAHETSSVLTSDITGLLKLPQLVASLAQRLYQ